MLVASKTCRACGRGFTGAEVFCPHDGSRLLGELSPLAEGSDPLLGSVLDGRYRVLRIVGEGGMGIVYEAEHTLIERRVAIKVLREDFCRKADVVERFRREAKSASRIGHPNIVDVLDFGETSSGASYCVMEMLQGQDLADQIARGGALAPERAAVIVYQCCHALGIAHEKGIVHRDLKPENIFLVERDGVPDFVKIVDFGVAKITEPDFEPGAGARAKLTRTGVIFGTPEYMSPEQATGLVPDHRVDVYALGITLYELLTGRVPFEGESFMSVLSKHANRQVPALRDMNPRLKISRELENVVFGALRKDRGERFQHMRDMAAALTAAPEMPPLPFRLSGPHASNGRAARDVAASSRPGATVPVTESESSVSPPPAPPDLPVTEPRARTPKLALALGAAVALSVLGVALSVRVTGSPDARSPAASSETAAAIPSAPAEPPPAGPPPAESPPAEPPPAPALTPVGPIAVPSSPELVTVRVTTKPAGASLRLEGGKQLCASTPCSFESERGSSISVQARRGHQRAAVTLTPGANTDLHLVLRAAQDKQGKSPAPAATAPPADLKVPELYK